VALRTPPPASDLEPLLVEVPTGTVLFRVHSAHREPTSFNPGRGRPGRFHPLVAGDPPVVVPTLYAASSIPGALSESVFHDVPYRGRAKRVLVSRLDGLVLSAITTLEPVIVAQLAGAGLRRIEVRRRDLIEGGPATYPRTVEWAAALHEALVQPLGLAWTSRQDDTARVCVLFGDRVQEVHLIMLSPPLPLEVGPGLDLVEQAAADAGIAVVR
jgi:hypothetical protein